MPERRPTGGCQWRRARQRIIGVVVDAMSDVTDVAMDQIKPPPPGEPA